MRVRWSLLPRGLRRCLVWGAKAVLTGGAFYLLLSHPIETASGDTVAVWRALAEHLGGLDPSAFVPLLLAATAIKLVGIACSMGRWHLLLIGQGIRFDVWHVVGAFLTGRFLGTFLPSTAGLDGYKLYDAARFSGRLVQPAAATAVEKAMGLGGIFLTFLLTLPLGMDILGPAAGTVVAVTVPLACGVLAGLFLALFRPWWVQGLLRLLPDFGRQRLQRFITQVSEAVAAYGGQGMLLAVVMVLSFAVHFATAAMYYLTALAVGATGAGFWQVSFASSIQILATVMSPFTIAGEGVREIVQALLLARHIGTSASVLSAALGFWAAEAVTLVGVFFWWGRGGAHYRPRRLWLDGVPVQGPELSAAGAGDERVPCRANNRAS